MAGTIVAMGGISWDDEERRPLEDYWLGLTGAERPRVLVVPTAVAETPSRRCASSSSCSDRADVSLLPFFPWPPADLRELALAQDVIFVAGGNTANTLAIWRVHGFDADPARGVGGRRRADGLERRDDLLVRGRRDRLVRPAARGHARRARLPARERVPALRRRGRRRPVYTRLVAREGFPAGLAADDCVALRFEGTELAEVVSSRAGSRAYRVSAEGEERLERGVGC